PLPGARAGIFATPDPRLSEIGLSPILSMPFAPTAPVPVALGADIDMYGLRVAIGADAASARHGTGIGRQLPFADARHLDVGGGAEHVQRIVRAARGSIVDRVAIA